MALGNLPAPWSHGRAKLAVRLTFAFAAEMLVFLAFFALYFFVRGLPVDDVATSTHNALDIVRLERFLGIYSEAAWQDAALGHPALVDLANFTYRFLHLPLIGIIGFAFFCSDRRKFRVLRNTILISGFMAALIYYYYPVTPPRLLAEQGVNLGFIDTLEGARQVKPGPFTNHYAAMPSYHFGWILLVTIGMWWVWRPPILRAAGVALAVLMWWAIVVTGNHFFLDMVAGAVMVLIALFLSLRWERYARSTRTIRRRFPVVLDHRLPF